MRHSFDRLRKAQRSLRFPKDGLSLTAIMRAGSACRRLLELFEEACIVLEQEAHIGDVVSSHDDALQT